METTRFLNLTHALRMALEAYEADNGKLPAMRELFRIQESNGSPSFRFVVEHLRQIIDYGDVSE